MVFSIEPAKAELNKAKKAGRSPTVREGAGTTASRDADMPKNALGIMDLSNGQVAKIERVKNFQVPEDGAGFIAYLLEAKPTSPNKEGAAPKETPTSPSSDNLEDADASAAAPQSRAAGRG